MIEAVILVLMIYLHIYDDFNKQGILATFKQKEYWKENYPDELYKNDYKISLLMHSFSWATSIMIIPVLYQIYMNNYNFLLYILLFKINIDCHAFIDNLKCNKKKISLMTDQILHLIQIIATWFLIIIM